MVIGFVVMYYLKSKKDKIFDTSKAVEEHNALIDGSGINWPESFSIIY